MFGHADNQQQTDNQYSQGQVTPDPAFSNDQVFNDDNQDNPISAQPAGNNYLNDIPAAPAAPNPASDTGSLTLPSDPLTPASSLASDDSVAPGAPIASSDDTTPDNSNLLDIKQKALQQLSPLVSHLNQNPEDKFKTTMMMIQASDDQALLPEAYKAAQEITDEKAKAQALLDVVNEINYFTQAQ